MRPAAVLLLLPLLSCAARRQNRHDGPRAVQAAAPAASGLEKKRSQEHCLSGVLYWKEGRFELARDEWTLAVFLDPDNTEAKTGLERAEALLNGE